MAIKVKVLIVLLFLNSLNILFAQQRNVDKPVLPKQPNKAILFGKDIMIHDSSAQDQRNLAICSAFNGWLYAVYSYNNGIQPRIAVIRSTDDGITWNLLSEGNSFFQHYLITKFDIIACGNKSAP